MPQTWISTSGGDISCPNPDCGAVYEVTLTSLPASAPGFALCQVCGGTLDSWCGATSKSFRLIEMRDV